MTSDLTPFQRLIQLEYLVSKLQVQLNPSTPCLEETALPQRHVWPADELLLTRLIRRNPEALRAYESPAELIQTNDHGVLLKAVAESSPFRLCELSTGDAVVWVFHEHDNWLYETDIFRSVFMAPAPPQNNDSLVLQLLPRFIRKVQGREWTLERPGQMIPRSRPFTEQAAQAELEQRIQKIEQSLARLRGGLDYELSALRSHVQILQDQLDGFLRLRDDYMPAQPTLESSPERDFDYFNDSMTGSPFIP
jgi:hypothetical protein